MIDVSTSHSYSLNTSHITLGTQMVFLKIENPILLKRQYCKYASILLLLFSKNKSNYEKLLTKNVYCNPSVDET